MFLDLNYWVDTAFILVSYAFLFPNFKEINFFNLLFQTNWLVIKSTNFRERLSDYPQFNSNNLKIILMKDMNIYKTFINHDDFLQERQTLVYTGKDYNPKCFNQAYVHAIFYERVDVMIFQNAFIQGWNAICTEGYRYDLYNNFKDIYTPQYAQFSSRYKTIDGYRYVIAPIARWLPTFGHWITDCICPLLFLEDWIWNLNPVICLDNVGEELFREYMKIMGHDNVTLVNRHNGYIYGETMFVVKGYAPEIPCGVKSLPILVERISKYYGLESIKPEYYGYMNKDNSNRRILNFKEIISKLEEENHIEIKELYVNRPDRITFARTIASLKLLICPGGSIAYNAIFTKQNTGFITLDSECLEGPVLQIACHLKVWHIEIMHPGVPHFNHPFHGNIGRTLYSFRVLNYAIEHQHWPQNNLFSPYNFTLFKQHLKNNEIPQNLQVNKFIPELFKIYLDSHVNEDF